MPCISCSAFPYKENERFDSSDPVPDFDPILDCMIQPRTYTGVRLPLNITRNGIDTHNINDLLGVYIAYF